MKIVSLRFTRQLRFFAFILTAIFLTSCSSTKKLPTDSPLVNKPVEIKSEVSSGELELCKTKVSNAPEHRNGLVLRKPPNVCISGIDILVAPAPKACLSSGYGPRHNRLHRGIDYQSKPAGKVIAASDGTVIDVLNRPKDYGNWIIIDHGKGVYSSYAHLANISRKIRKGEKVSKGQTLGKMGQTGKAARAIHLHFEVRTGDYSNQKKWWGLSPVNLFELPEEC